LFSIVCPRRLLAVPRFITSALVALSCLVCGIFVAEFATFSRTADSCSVFSLLAPGLCLGFLSLPPYFSLSISPALLRLFLDFFSFVFCKWTAWSCAVVRFPPIWITLAILFSLRVWNAAALRLDFTRPCTFIPAPPFPWWHFPPRILLLLTHFAAHLPRLSSVLALFFVCFFLSGRL